jgi:hypothetical protein
MEIPQTPMDLEQARKEMREWLADLEALRPHCDPNDPKRGVFNVAWTEAYARASAATAAYVKAMTAQ